MAVKVNNVGKETRARLIHSTKSLINRLGISGVTSTLVLSESGVSKSSLYHFFQDFDELINEAQIQQYKEIDTSWHRNIRELSSTSSSAAEFYSGLVSALISFMIIQKQDIRYQRVTIIANSKNSLLLDNVIVQLQEELIVGLTQAFELAQAKGFLVGTYSPRSIAVALQALLFGKIFDDVLLDSMEDRDWVSLSLQIFKDAFLSED